MKNGSEIPLQYKILSGYIVLVVVIGSMVAIILHERKRVLAIEAETGFIHQVQHNMNMIYYSITQLTIRGETAIAWQEEDLADYHLFRLHVDSMLHIMYKESRGFVTHNQIDTIRNLLISKEEHLRQIMQLLRVEDDCNELLVNCLLKEVCPQTITRKKKGFAGILGAKETIKVTPSASTTYHALNKKLQFIKETRLAAIDLYTDSLHNYNKDLNQKLRTLITTINNHIECTLAAKGRHLEASYDNSMNIFTWLIIFTIVLLAIFYLIIQRDIKAKADHDKLIEVTLNDLQDNIKENQRLTDARQRIIQTITHELRTPLAAIVGNAELIEHDKKAERLHHLDSIQQSAKRMISLLDNLMNYFRLDSGKEQVTLKPFHLNSIVDVLYSEFTPQAEVKQLAFQTNNCRDEVVIGDKDLLLRIGGNLLSNAIKFTERGMISLSAVYENGIFKMIIEDTGSGITKEQQKRIFRPFERLTNAATQDGFGLGLTIVQELIELMKGELILDSTQGKGSRFCVKIPLEQADEIDFDKSVVQITQPLHNCSVLVLDNDEILLAMTRDMLIRKKIDCDICCNIRELLEKMRIKNYDLLITDMKMPDMNGYEVMELLHSSDIGNSRNIPIIISTAMDKSSEEELLAAGFCGCLFKPFSSDEAAVVIMSCINNKLHKQKIDLSDLLVYGNKEETLEQLITETKDKMVKVREAYEKRDIAKLEKLIHHLRSSWMIIHADYSLRELYDLIHSSQYDEILLDKRVQNVLDTGIDIIQKALEIQNGLWEK